MNRSEAAQALVVAAAHDNRSIGETNVAAWADALDDLRLVDVVAAVKLHYRAETSFLMPAQVRTIVKRIRSERVTAALMPAPPPELSEDPPASLAWQRDIIRRIADGETLEQVELTARPVGQLLAGAFTGTGDRCPHCGRPSPLDSTTNVCQCGRSWSRPDVREVSA